MAEIVLYKHGDLNIYLDLNFEDPMICFSQMDAIHLVGDMALEGEKYDKMASKLKDLFKKLNDPGKSERELVELYINFISEWCGHEDIHILRETEMHEYVDKDGNICKCEEYVFKLNDVYVYDRD